MSKRIFRTKKHIRTQKILTGLVIGGSLIGATAILFVAPIEGVETAAKPAPIEQEIAWRQEFEPLPTKTQVAPVVEIEVEAEPIEAARPVVALAHEEPERDFETEANERMVLGDLATAFTLLRKHLYSDAPTPDVLLHVGQLGRQLGEYAIAEQALMDATAIDTSRADIQTELARVRLDAGDLEEARFAAREAIRTEPRDAEAWNVAGRVAMAMSEFHRAAEAFEESLDLDPTQPIVHNNAGLNYLYMKHGPEAVNALETAVDLYEERAPHFVFNNLGLAHELVGNYEEAREAFEESLLVSPFYARAKINLRRVETTIVAVEEARAFQTARGVTIHDLDDTVEEDLDIDPTVEPDLEIDADFQDDVVEPSLP